MLTDGLELIGQSSATNFAIATGTSFPDGSPGELFYLNGTGLHIYNGTAWEKVAPNVDTGIPVGATLPAVGKIGSMFFQTDNGLFVSNGTAWIKTTSYISTAHGTSFPATAAVGDLYYHLSNGLTVWTGSGWVPVTNRSVIPYDIAGSIFGKPTAPSLVFRFIANRPFLLPAGLGGSAASTSTVATAATSLAIYRNGTQIGSINFAAGATNGTFTFLNNQNFVKGDLLTIGYQTADTTFGDAQFTLEAVLA